VACGHYESVFHQLATPRAAWDGATLTWDDVPQASRYQVIICVGPDAFTQSDKLYSFSTQSAGISLEKLIRADEFYTAYVKAVLRTARPPKRTAPTPRTASSPP
jgi:hypothetical protein